MLVLYEYISLTTHLSKLRSTIPPKKDSTLFKDLLQNIPIDILVSIASFDDTGNLWFLFTWLNPHFKQYAYKEGAIKYIELFTKHIIDNRTKCTMLFDRYHSMFDLPAVEVNGDKHWYKDGKLHRDSKNPEGESLPAMEFASGNKRWYKDGYLHRDNDLPAVIHIDGYKAWYKEGRLHRDNDLPAKIFACGDKEWYINGNLHRDNDLPAIESINGRKHWFKEGHRHRDNDLPAIECINGRNEWYKNGKKYR